MHIPKEVRLILYRCMVPMKLETTAVFEGLFENDNTSISLSRLKFLKKMFSDPTRIAETYEYLYTDRVRGARPKDYADFDRLVSTLNLQMPQCTTSQMQDAVMRYMGDGTKLISCRFRINYRFTA